MDEFKGLDIHLLRLEQMQGSALEREVGKALFAAAELVQTEAQLSIRRGAVSGRFHVPSLPGEPPNENSGHLAGNIEATLRHPFLSEVASNAEYSAPLEFGTSKMDPRPFMRPARDKMRNRINQLVRAAMDRVIKGSGA